MLQEERPYEKFMQKGAENLSDSELLAIILRTGTKKMQVIEVANMILNKNDLGLLAIEELNVEDFVKINGIGKIKAIQLKCIGEIAKRLYKKKSIKRLSATSPGTVADYYMYEMSNMKRECLRVVLLDAKLGLISDEYVQMGTSSGIKIEPSQLFCIAIRKSAERLIIIHNHPSGDSTPSECDIEFTKRMIECGKILHIKVEDHIVIGNNEYTSIRKNGLVEFE